MPITYQAGAITGVGLQATGNHNVAVPAGVAAGDVVVIFYGISIGPPPVLSSSGFTSITPAAASGANAGVLWKVATAADTGNYVVNNPSGAGGGSGQAVAVRFRGVDTANPWNTTTTGVTASGANGTSPSVSLTTTRPNTLLVWLLNEDNGWANTVPPAGWTEIADSNNNIGVAVKDQAAVGSTGSFAGSHGTSGQIVVWAGALQEPLAGGNFFSMFN